MVLLDFLDGYAVGDADKAFAESPNRRDFRPDSIALDGPRRQQRNQFATFPGALQYAFRDAITDFDVKDIDKRRSSRIGDKARHLSRNPFVMPAVRDKNPIRQENFSKEKGRMLGDRRR